MGGGPRNPGKMGKVEAQFGKQGSAPCPLPSTLTGSRWTPLTAGEVCIPGCVFCYWEEAAG